MKVDVQIYNINEKLNYNKSLFEKIAYSIIKKFGNTSKSIETVTISIAFVSDAEIRNINNNLRGKNKETDVISIGDYSDDLDISTTREKNIFLGEIIMCYNYIETNAIQNKIDSNCEVLNVYTHGVLHLLGFKHGKEMFDLQDDTLREFCDKK